MVGSLGFAGVRVLGLGMRRRKIMVRRGIRVRVRARVRVRVLGLKWKVLMTRWWGFLMVL